jgi:hypothetical protein
VTSVPRLPLADTLVGLLESLVPERAAAGGIRLGAVRLSLPLELRLGDDGQLLGNVSRWRWTTDFDAPPSQLAASFHPVQS